jgi:hypothetical protein
VEAAAHAYRDPGKYFEVLHRTLVEVFRRDDAESMVTGLAVDIATSRSDDERLLFFHAEPIATAEDMTGQRPTPEMYDRYLDLARRLGWNAGDRRPR